MSVMDALEAVYKSDPVVAESMIDDIVMDLLADEALDNARLLNRTAAAYVGQRVAVAKRALLRQYAKDVANGHYPEDEVHKAAEWLAGLEMYAVEVAKADPLAAWTQADERKHKRDALGRFARGVNQNKTRDPLQYASTQQIAQPLRQKIQADQQTGVRSLTGIDAKRAQQVQGQYEQADEMLREFGGAFSASERKNINALLQIKDSDGNIQTLSVPLSQAAHGIPDDLYQSGGLSLEHDILSVEIDAGSRAPEAVAAKVRNFNTMGAMGGSHMAALASLDEKQRGALTQALMPRRPEEGKLSSLFGRFRAGADVLDATGHDKLGTMARFMGSYGPEAEKVLDPRVRQTAYRYRGTEKEPDINLMRHMNSPEMNTVEAVAREQGKGETPITDRVMSGSNKVGATSPVAGATRYNLQHADETGEPLTEDQLNMRVRSDVATMHLMQTIPLDRKVAELSQKAGNILPSQGVLIDSDGNVVSQSVGFGDDTYLPFDYNNMKRSMRGGQYVRTRVQGGLTGEDIAAAVGNGARMATVVSSSGVHSIEFDPNLRGTRANSDKARSMYRRYLQILDAVENSGMYEQDIDPREKSKLKARAAEVTGQRSGSTFDTTYERMLEEARAQSSQLSEEELDGLMDQATKMVMSQGGGKSPQQTQNQINDVYEELEQKASAAKASKLRLNADGYRVALETLQQQFPYFIRNVSYEPLAGQKGEPGFLDSRGQQPTPGGVRQRLKATDQGYMRPGGTRAASVRTGFYQTDEAAPGPKTAVGGPRFMEEQAAKKKAAETTAGGTPGAPGTPSPMGLSGPSGGPSGGLTGRLAGQASVAEAERKKALVALADISSTMQQFQVAQKDRPTEKWESTKDLGNAAVITYWLTQPDLVKTLQDPEKGPRISQAITDRNAVKQGFGSALQHTAGGDYFGTPESPTNNTFGTPEVGIARNKDEAAELVADLALKVVDTGLVTQPFVNPRGGDEGDLYHTGSRPQNLPIGGVPANEITNSKQLDNVLRANPKVAALAQQIGMDPGGDGYKSAAAVSAEMTDRINVLKDLKASIESAAGDESRAMGMASNLSTHLKTTMDHTKYLQILQEMTGVKINSPDDLVKLGQLDEWKDIDLQAARHQQAWALINAGRGVNVAEGGGVASGPKDRWVAKNLQGVSTRLERVRKDASPLAREISRRRLAGLPFIPAR